MRRSKDSLKKKPKRNRKLRNFYKRKKNRRIRKRILKAPNPKSKTEKLLRKKNYKTQQKLR
jgi:hypothetical protein